MATISFISPHSFYYFNYNIHGIDLSEGSKSIFYQSFPERLTTDL